MMGYNTKIAIHNSWLSSPVHFKMKRWVSVSWRGGDISRLLHGFHRQHRHLNKMRILLEWARRWYFQCQSHKGPSWGKMWEGIFQVERHLWYPVITSRWRRKHYFIDRAFCVFQSLAYSPFCLHRLCCAMKLTWTIRQSWVIYAQVITVRGSYCTRTFTDMTLTAGWGTSGYSYSLLLLV